MKKMDQGTVGRGRGRGQARILSPGTAAATAPEKNRGDLAITTRYGLNNLCKTGRVLLDQGMQFLYYLLRDAQNLPIPQMALLQTEEEHYQEIIQTRSGKLLRVLVCTPAFLAHFDKKQAASSDVEEKAIKLKSRHTQIKINPFINVFGRLTIPKTLLKDQVNCSSISEYLYQENNGALVLSSGIHPMFQKDGTALESFVKLHALYHEIAKILLTCEEALDILNVGGDACLDDLREPVVVLMDALEELYDTAINCTKELLDLATVRLMGIKELKIEKHPSDKLWVNNLKAAFAIKKMLSDGVGDCLKMIRTVREKVSLCELPGRSSKKISSDEMQSFIRASGSHENYITDFLKKLKEPLPVSGQGGWTRARAASAPMPAVNPPVAAGDLGGSPRSVTGGVQPASPKLGGRGVQPGSPNLAGERPQPPARRPPPPQTSPQLVYAETATSVTPGSDGLSTTERGRSVGGVPLKRTKSQPPSLVKRRTEAVSDEDIAALQADLLRTPSPRENHYMGSGLSPAVSPTVARHQTGAETQETTKSGSASPKAPSRALSQSTSAAQAKDGSGISSTTAKPPAWVSAVKGGGQPKKENPTSPALGTTEGAVLAVRPESGKVQVQPNSAESSSSRKVDTLLPAAPVNVGTVTATPSKPVARETVSSPRKVDDLQTVAAQAKVAAVTVTQPNTPVAEAASSPRKVETVQVAAPAKVVATPVAQPRVPAPEPPSSPRKVEASQLAAALAEEAAVIIIQRKTPAAEAASSPGTIDTVQVAAPAKAAIAPVAQPKMPAPQPPSSPRKEDASQPAVPPIKVAAVTAEQPKTVVTEPAASPRKVAETTPLAASATKIAAVTPAQPIVAGVESTSPPAKVDALRPAVPPIKVAAVTAEQPKTAVTEPAASPRKVAETTPLAASATKIAAITPAQPKTVAAESASSWPAPGKVPTKSSPAESSSPRNVVDPQSDASPVKTVTSSVQQPTSPLLKKEAVPSPGSDDTASLKPAGAKILASFWDQKIKGGQVGSPAAVAPAKLQPVESQEPVPPASTELVTSPRLGKLSHKKPPSPRQVQGPLAERTGAILGLGGADKPVKTDKIAKPDSSKIPLGLRTKLALRKKGESKSQEAAAPQTEPQKEDSPRSVTFAPILQPEPKKEGSPRSVTFVPPSQPEPKKEGSPRSATIVVAHQVESQQEGSIGSITSSATLVAQLKKEPTPEVAIIAAAEPAQPKKPGGMLSKIFQAQPSVEPARVEPPCQENIGLAQPPASSNVVLVKPPVRKIELYGIHKNTALDREVNDQNIQEMLTRENVSRTEVTQLMLRKNNIRCAGIVWLCDDFLSENTTLQHLDLSSNEKLFCPPEKSATAKLIGFFQDDSIIAVSGLLKRDNLPLKDLLIANCGLNTEGAAILASGLRANTTLELLDIHKNYIGDLGAQWICEALTQHPTVTYLLMNNNCITDEGALFLLQLVAKNPRITYLELRGNNIDPELLENIELAVSENRRAAESSKANGF